MWITAAALGAALPVLLLHFRCSTPVPGYRLPIAYYPLHITDCTLPIAHYPLPIPNMPNVSYIQMQGCSHGIEYFAFQDKRKETTLE